MNAPRESIGAAAVRILSRMIDAQRPAKPRRFRPLAEPMEGRIVLSHLNIPGAIIDPIVPATVETVVVNGQVEIQPGDVVVNGQVEIQPGDVVRS
jgi:hypothetical protein